MKTLALLPVLLAGYVALQDPVPQEPTAQHHWLQQLVGEWTCKVEASMDGQPPTQMETVEHCRSFGATYVVAEGEGTANGTQVRTLLTIGYDVAKGTFVGTWIDTMQTHLFVYKGTLDDARKVLTLETEGPSFGDPKQTSTYRDAIEIVDADHKRLTSSVRNADGSWTRFMTANYQRKR